MKAYFLSDLHLGAPYLASTREAERRVVAFLDRIGRDADVIYLLGDVLDYWYEYRYVVPRGFVRFFGKLAELADSGVRIVWMIGNHDIWIFDYLPKELGIEVVDGTLSERIGDATFFLTHGDGVGKLPRSFRFLRSLFRSRFCQWMYGAVNPRWTIPFAYAWSAHSRKTGYTPECPDCRLVDNLRRFSLQWLKTHPDIDWFIYGHVHVLLRERLTPVCGMVILGEWIKTFSYAVYDGSRLALGRWRWRPGEEGVMEEIPAGSQAPEGRR